MVAIPNNLGRSIRGLLDSSPPDLLVVWWYTRKRQSPPSPTSPNKPSPLDISPHNRMLTKATASLEDIPVFELQHLEIRRVESGGAEKYYRRWNLRLGRYAGGRTGEAFGGD